MRKLMLRLTCLFLLTGTFALPMLGQTPNSKPKVVSQGPLGTITKCVAAGGDVYWLEDDQKILYANREIGGYPKLLLRTNTLIQYLAADSASVFYLSENKFESGEDQADSFAEGELRSTGKKKPIITLRPNLRVDKTTVIGSDATDIYLITSDENQNLTIMRVPKSGGQMKSLGVRIRFSVNSAVVDARDIYWLDTGLKTISAVSKEGGPPRVVSESQNEKFDSLLTAVDETHLYLVSKENEILQVDKIGGKFRVLSPANGGQVFEMHLNVDGSDLYWIDNNNIMRMKTSGGTASVFAQAESPTCLTVDDKYVYWFEGKGLVKAPK